MLTDWGCSNWK